MSDVETPPPNPDGISGIEIQEEMEQSFLDYAMSVIISRALPDARDGLKPVHRRILWSMSENGLRPDRGHVKCANVVGDVIAKYHPHGDQSIYDALVRLGQDFSMRHVLIDPHGNFGSPADPPAAYRYTECRLSQLAMHMLDGIDEDTVDFESNFDGRHDEPTVLPARFPNLLVNGSQGIAVGMATNIPPHNLGEVIDAVTHLLANPDADNADLMRFVKGPDFPTGGLIMGTSGARAAYGTGRGSVKVRALAEIEEVERGARIVVSEMPYQVSVEAVMEKVADLVDRRELDGIRDIRDESAKGVTRLVIELKRDAPALVVLNKLYKLTPLQTNFAVNMVALDSGVPRTMTLRDCLVAYVAHQIEVVTRRSEFRLAKAKARAHILEGLIRALDVIDEIIALIRQADDADAARDGLVAEPFSFSEVQANHILDMPLRRLTRLDYDKLTEELAEKRAHIEELEAILADDARLRGVIAEELTEIRSEFAQDRRSRLTIDEGEIDIEDLIDDEDLVFTMTASGYVKTVAADEFRTQGRGGRGVSGANLKDGDYVDTMIHTSAHAYLMFFTSLGRVFRLKAHEVPLASRTARGTAVVNLLELGPEEKVAAVIDTRDYETKRFLFFATRKGQVKKTRFNEYDTSRRGLIAIKLKEDDELVRVLSTDGDDDVCLISASGRLMRFAETEVRPMGRAAAGVRGMKLRADDSVVGCDVVRDDATLLVVTESGYGKRTELDAFAAKHRGGQGVTAIKLTGERGRVVAALVVGEGDELFAIASNGVVIRMSASDISLQGAYATGVRVMTVADDQRVAAVAPVLGNGNGDEDHGDEPAPDGRGSPDDGRGSPDDGPASDES